MDRYAIKKAKSQLPLLDNTDFKEKIKSLATQYVPEWDYDEEDPDVGVAFSKVMEDMFSDTARTLNKVPNNYYLFFLNMLGAKITPAMSSNGLITVKTKQEKGNYLKKGTKVFANGAEGKINFETLEAMYTLDVRADKIFYTDGAEDTIYEMFENENDSANIEKSFKMFCKCGDNLQKHDIYIAANPLLITNDKTMIQIKLKDEKSLENEKYLLELFTDKNKVGWQYYLNGEWNSIENVYAKDGKIMLEFEGCSEECEINSAVDRYIRCSVFKLTDNIIKLTGVDIATHGDDLLPDGLLCNNSELARADFFPFGEELNTYTDFYIGSEEAFSKKDANVTVDFEMQFLEIETDNGAHINNVNYKNVMHKSDFEEPPEVNVSILKVNWEYWNGLGWAKLFKDNANEDFFVVKDEQIVKKKLEFKCPKDMKPSGIGPAENYFIRARITKLKNPFNAFQKYVSPYIHEVKIAYEYDNLVPVSELSVDSNRTMKKVNLTEIGEKAVIRKELCDSPVMYFNLSKPIDKGPFSVLFDIDDTLCESFPKVQWEYYSVNEKGYESWQPMQIVDRTEGFKHSGIVIFMGKSDFKKTCLLGETGYFVRVVNTDMKYRKLTNKNDYPIVKGIYPNSVTVNQQETLSPELFATQKFERDKVCVLSKRNLLTLNVWVDEFETLSIKEEGEFINREDCENIIIDRDSNENITHIWVKWKEVKSIVLAKPNERVYEADYNDGVITFGNGEQGKMPPYKESKSIKVVYSVSKGEAGNVDKNMVVNFSDANSYLNSITNVKPMAGGIDEETNDQAVKRVATDLFSMNRVVSADDFKQAIVAYNRGIYDLRCVPHYDYNGDYVPGKISIAVLPRQYMQGYEKFELFKRNIYKFIENRVPVTMLADGKIDIFEAFYVEIGMYLEVVAFNYGNCHEAELKVNELMKKFLDPVEGNFDHNGWPIGRIPTKHQLYNVIKTVKEIKWIKQANAFARIVTKHGIKDVDFDKIRDNPFVVPVCGKIDVNVMVDSEENL